MYADNMTGSMKEAVGEVVRRRKYQEDYNKTHKITPQAIVKPMRERLIEKIEEEVGKEVFEIKDIPEGDRQRLMEYLEAQMKAASDILDFETAAKLRDQIKELNV